MVSLQGWPLRYSGTRGSRDRQAPRRSPPRKRYRQRTNVLRKHDFWPETGIVMCSDEDPVLPRHGNRGNYCNYLKTKPFECVNQIL
jgi:hypothetical protein